jgi:hypothetical protein
MSNSSDNSLGKTIALVGGIIGILVSCIAVFTFVTGVDSLNILNTKAGDTGNDYSTIEVNPTSPSEPVTTSSAYADSTPSGIRNPTGPVPAGVPVLAEDFSLIVENDYKILTADQEIVITILVKNVGNRKHLLNYTRSAISLIDDTGQSYTYRLSQGSDLYVNLQKDIEPNEVFSIQGTPFYGTDSPEWLPTFQGPISAQAKKLIVRFNSFGPFNSVEVELEL